MNRPNWPQEAYRYLEPKYADDLGVRGAVRIGTLASFGRLEDAQCDPCDGAVRYDIGNLRIGDAAKPKHQAKVALARHIGVGVQSGDNVLLQNCQARIRYAGNALCLSQRPDNPLFLNEGKTAVFEVPDLLELGLCITHFGQKALGTTVDCDFVTYEKRRFTECDGVRDPDPFIKEIAFKKEEEIRIFWATRGTQIITVAHPAIAELVRRIS